jgi:hypothetical protein
MQKTVTNANTTRGNKVLTRALLSRGINGTPFSMSDPNGSQRRWPLTPQADRTACPAIQNPGHACQQNSRRAKHYPSPSATLGHTNRAADIK